MAQLVGLIVSENEGFKKQVDRLLRSGPIPVGVTDERIARDGTAPDIVVVDVCGDASSAISHIERIRGAAPHAGLVAVSQTADQDLILHSIHSGPNDV